MPHADLPVARHGVVILIDPPSYHYFENRFFDLTTPLNRDQTLRPNAEMKARLEAAGYPVFTADMLESVRPHYSDCRFDYRASALLPPGHWPMVGKMSANRGWHSSSRRW